MWEEYLARNGRKWQVCNVANCFISCSSTMYNSCSELYYAYELNCILFYLLNAQRKRRNHTRQKHVKINNVTRMKLAATRIPNPWILIQQMLLTVPKAGSIFKKPSLSIYECNCLLKLSVIDMQANVSHAPCFFFLEMASTRELCRLIQYYTSNVLWIGFITFSEFCVINWMKNWWKRLLILTI